ncbi:MAG: hypothetical protein Kow0010_05640 [Dehalococcoidia bacterium]
MLAITPTAVRQHLGPLVAEGLVTFRETGSGPGRRKRLYRLTRAGDALFPSVAGEVAPSLLAELRDADPDRATAFFRRLHDGVAQKVADSLPLHAPPEAAADALVRSFGERAFMPALCDEADDSVCLCLYHCPLLALAGVAPEVCACEQAMIARLLPWATVTRTRHRLAGDRTCAYTIARRAD